MTKVTRGFGFSLMVVLTLAAVACSTASAPAGPTPGAAGSKAAGSATETQSKVSQGVTKDTIKIGMFGPMSGSASVYGKNVQAVQSIYMDQNEKGGINGRKLEFVVEDDAGDPANAPVVFKKLAESDKVFMIHGGPSSPPTLSMKPLIEASGIPFLFMSGVGDKVTDPPVKNLFSGYPASIDQAGAVAEFAKSIGPKKVAVVTQKDEWGKGWREPFVKAMKDYNIEIVADEEIGTEIGDATSLVRIVMKSQAEVLALFSYPQPTSVFLRDAYSQGLKIPVITGSGSMPEDVVRRVGQREPVLSFFSSYTLKYLVDAPQYDPYKAMVAKYFPKLIFDAGIMGGMSGAMANIEILKRMGEDLTWDNYIKTAEGLKDFETPVMASPVSFKPFDQKDPTTRRGVRKAAMTVLNPDPKGAPFVVVKDWAEYQKIAK